jgi:hypothetical protein
MSFGFRYRDIWIWYVSPSMRRYRPSVSAEVFWLSESLHPLATSAMTATARTTRRRIGPGF